MDVRIGAAPMEAKAEMPEVTVTANTEVVFHAISLIERVAPFSCPSIAGSSLSAVAPDTNFEMEELAEAA